MGRHQFRMADADFAILGRPAAMTRVQHQQNIRLAGFGEAGVPAAEIGSPPRRDFVDPDFEDVLAKQFLGFQTLLDVIPDLRERTAARRETAITLT